MAGSHRRQNRDTNVRLAHLDRDVDVVSSSVLHTLGLRECHLHHPTLPISMRAAKKRSRVERCRKATTNKTLHGAANTPGAVHRSTGAEATFSALTYIPQSFAQVKWRFFPFFVVPSPEGDAPYNQTKPTPRLRGCDRLKAQARLTVP